MNRLIKINKIILLITLTLSLFSSKYESDLAKRRYLFIDYAKTENFKVPFKSIEEAIYSNLNSDKYVYQTSKQKLILEFINYLLVIILFVLLRIQKTKSN